ncbi:uncharacterized protein LOC142981116 [Anticarsia gemmatalis]|uniref:uncharacterized protein LOC142981116 n=1 Tax=Anticarsia gemmatalis TaxID=129554 RepID=UPI003F775CB5
MKLQCVLILLFVSYVLCNTANVVTRVQVLEPAGYIVPVINKIVNSLEDKPWCNLKVPDVTVPIDQIIIDWVAKGDIHYKDGFLASVQGVDILRDSVGQQVLLNSEQKAQALVRGTLRLHNVTIGYNVHAELKDGDRYYTATHIHNTVTFRFNIVKLVDGDDMTVTVIGEVPINRNLPSFSPMDHASDAFTTLFDPTMSSAAIKAWEDILQPIAYVAAKEVPFPDICFDCALVA